MKFALTLFLAACFIAALQAAAVEPSTVQPAGNEADPSTTVASDDASGFVHPACHQPKVIGRCFGLFPRYAYNLDNGLCEEFVYGGCGGNQNNFESKQACEAKCLRHNDEAANDEAPNDGVANDEVANEESSTPPKVGDDGEPAPVVPADEKPVVVA